MNKNNNPNKSHLTAIGRKKLPSPTQWLLKNKCLGDIEFEDVVLDYGCGKCHSVNNQHFVADGYDPHYFPNGLSEGWSYNFIICNYVLCVIPTHQERMAVLQKIQLLLTKNGVAYISLNIAEPKSGWGYG